MNLDYIPHNGPIVTRADAKSLGLGRYFTGKPCKYGHVSERMANNSGCLECHRIGSRNYGRNNPEKAREAYLKNKEKIDAYQIEYRIANKEKIDRQYKKWRRAKPWKYRFAGAKRAAAKIKATPVWCDLEKIKEIYFTCPDGWHVDHIIPLQGDEVCGLHIPINLRHLPALENCKKNKFMPADNMIIDYAAPGWQ